MLIGDPAPRERAQDFCGRWPDLLRARLSWFAAEVGAGEPDPAALDGLVVSVVDRIGEERSVEPVPEWYDATLASAGWSAYGAALAEGLTAFVAEVYATRLGRPLPWVLDDDPKSAYHLKPVVDVHGIAPPWRQVIGALRQVQSGKDPGRLRSVVEHSLAQLPPREQPRPEQAAEVVEVTAVDRGRWQVSFPEDIDTLLGSAAYADLEDALAGVEGVTAAVMEDRDRALLSTGEGVDRADLEQRLGRAVDALRDR
ncbi:hypothetical protein NYO98_13610 [Nocardioides sp. STR2]|uniref:Uncharacterized protein n=1 Tax=Nocardioides pini TaxID=2975053 RepID=A0ABT4CH37_9ACTN|nr:hypothetical protein [Nocardioides pini]MCY4727319.1 hypothetical protein [Nocardioides pini]